MYTAQRNDIFKSELYTVARARVYYVSSYRSKVTVTKDRLIEIGFLQALKEKLEQYGLNDGTIDLKIKPNYKKLKDAIYQCVKMPEHEDWASVESELMRGRSDYEGITVINMYGATDKRECIKSTLERLYPDTHIERETVPALVQTPSMFVDRYNVKGMYVYVTNKYNDDFLDQMLIVYLADQIRKFTNISELGEQNVAFNNLINKLFMDKKGDLLELIDVLVPNITESLKEKKNAKRLENIKEQLENISAAEISQLEVVIEKRKNIINEHEEALRALYSELEQKQMKLFYMKALKDEAESKEQIDRIAVMVKKGTIVHLKFEQNGEIEYGLESPLKFWDEDLAKRMWDKRNTGILSGCTDAEKRIFEKIFLTREVIMNISEFGYMDSQGKAKHVTRNNLDGYVRSEYYVAIQEAQGVPNPHHYYYNCWGDNATKLARYYANRNYALLLVQLMQAIASINLGDTSVVGKLLNHSIADPSNRENTLYQRATAYSYKGKRYTINDLYKVLEEEDKAATIASTDQETPVKAQEHVETLEPIEQ